MANYRAGINQRRLDGLIKELDIDNEHGPAAAIVRHLNDDDLDQAVAIIEQHPTPAAHLLRLANSATYSRRAGRIDSVRRAAIRVGTHAAAAYLMAASIRASVAKKPTAPPIRQAIAGYFQHARAVSICAGVIGDDHPATRNQVAAAGLLHNIGELVILASVEVAAFDQLASATTAEHRLEIERQLIGCTHAELGAAILEAWRFAPFFSAAAEHYQAPPETHPDKPIIDTVYRAARLQQTTPATPLYWQRQAIDWPADIPRDRIAGWLLETERRR